MQHTTATIKLISKTEATAEQLVNAMLSACWMNGCRVISHHYHRFYPQGLTAVVILAESHLAIHTYPERGEIYADCFTCGSQDPASVVMTLASSIGGEIAKLETRRR